MDDKHVIPDPQTATEPAEHAAAKKRVSVAKAKAVEVAEEPVAAAPEHTDSTIEEHARACNTSPTVFAGVAVHAGWTAGATVSSEEYKKAVAAFLGAPASGDGAPTASGATEE